MLKLAIVVSLLSIAYSDSWAVLIAGSNGFYNYRHQADVCHAFQLLTGKGGYPKENVIVMMYDDIAYDPSNPLQGNIINKPNGTNVYLGVNKDYTGGNVTAENFLNVLNGSKDAMKGIGSGRVVESGPDDDIFVYYSDHGATGLVGMPTGDYLYANQLIDTLKGMSADKKFKKLVFYLEACESGSMFDGLLPENIGIYATTAANPDESSYAYYWDSTRQTYLGDEYSIRWLEDSDSENEKSDTLGSQYKLLVTEVKESHPQAYGDLSIQSEVLGDFQSYGKSGYRKGYSSAQQGVFSSASSRDVRLFALTQKLHAASEETKGDIQAELLAEVAGRVHADEVFGKIATLMDPRQEIQAYISETKALPPRNFRCLRSAVDFFESKCGKFTEYSLKYVRVLNNLCEMEFGISSIHSAIEGACF